MTIDIILVQFSLGVLLFFIINWIGKHSYSIGYISISVFTKAEEYPAFNFLIRVLTPIVYLLVISTILYSCGLDKYVTRFYLVNCYYILFRLCLNLLIGRGLLLNWSREAIYWSSIIVLSYFAYNKLIIYKENLFPDLTTIANELWIMVLLFIYQIFNNVKLSTKGTVKRQDRYIEKIMAKFQRKYSKIINEKTDNDQLKGLVYSILIIENFNRPKVVRWFEYLSYFITRKPYTMGIMQYYSEKHINNKQSIIQGIEKINNGYIKLIEKYENEKLDYSELDFKSELANIYNTGTDYSSDVVEMWDIIMGKYYSETMDIL